MTLREIAQKLALWFHTFVVEIHHLAIIGEMFVLSVAALGVYWKYIRENIPLDFHHPVNAVSRSRLSSDHLESQQQENIGGPDIGNNNHAKTSSSSAATISGHSDGSGNKNLDRIASSCSNKSYLSDGDVSNKELIVHI